MTISKADAVKTIVGVAKGMGVTDPAQLAYILATAEHEAHLKPDVKEYGCASQAAKYGYQGGATYCGRGYVQITHLDNYKKFSKIVGKDLVSNPDLACNPEVSTYILIYGMKNGSFRSTGGSANTLDKYISGTKRDFVNARDIINGDTNKNGQRIANLAEKWLKQTSDLLAGAEPIIIEGAGGAASSVGTAQGPVSGPGPIGLISGVFTSNCTEPFPVSFNLAEALTYAGCKVKLAASQIAGSAFGMGAPSAAGLGASNTSAAIGGAPYTGPIPPGGFVRPCLCPTGTLAGQEYGAPRSYGGHSGQDFDCKVGTTIWAMADGTVSYAGEKGSYGNYVGIDHAEGLSSSYAHLSAIGVSVGQQVKRGDVVGKSGNTGSASKGPHLHFMVFLNGQHQNPLKFVSRQPPQEAAIA